MKFKRSKMAWGDQGTVGVSIPTIERLIMQGRGHPLVREQAGIILKNVPARNKNAEIAALFSWVKSNLRYTSDPKDVEYVQSAPGLIKAIRQKRAIGDCDDYIVLLGSLLESVGYQVSIVPTQADPKRKDYSHIYLEVRDQTGNQLALDPILPQAHPGKKVPWERRRMVLPVARNRVQWYWHWLKHWVTANWLPMVIGGVVVYYWIAKKR